jgi:hypothetical protein
MNVSNPVLNFTPYLRKVNEKIGISLSLRLRLSSGLQLLEEDLYHGVTNTAEHASLSPSYIFNILKTGELYNIRRATVIMMGHHIHV